LGGQNNLCWHQASIQFVGKRSYCYYESQPEKNFFSKLEKKSEG